MDFEDKMLQCAECGGEFVHSATDQQWYAQRGYTNEPKRCRTCREKRRSGGDDRGNRAAGAGASAGPSAPRGQREMYPATCAACGKPTQVPFQPRGNKPIYCRDCFNANRASR